MATWEESRLRMGRRLGGAWFDPRWWSDEFSAYRARGAGPPRRLPEWGGERGRVAVRNAQRGALASRQGVRSDGRRSLHAARLSIRRPDLPESAAHRGGVVRLQRPGFVGHGVGDARQRVEGADVLLGQAETGRLDDLGHW